MNPLEGSKNSSAGLKNRIIVYAGQYYDQETGLHYNYHRYYDPSLGRYLRADPIRLAGGVNLYGYAANNPVTLIGPYGLEWSYGFTSGLFGVDVNWNSADPTNTSYSTGTGVIAAVGGNFAYDRGKGVGGGLQNRHQRNIKYQSSPMPNVKALLRL